MDCEQTRSRLSDYIDGELSGELASGVAEHLESCPDCSRVHADLTNLVGLMQNMETIDEPADLVANVRSRLSPRLSPQPEAAPTPWSRLRAILAPPAVRIPAAAAALAAVLLMVLYLPAGREPGSLFPGDVGRDRGLAEEKPERARSDADAEGDFARLVDEEVVGEKLKRDRTVGEVDKLAAAEEELADELRDQAAPKQEPPAPASEVVELKKASPASVPAETAPGKDASVETAPRTDLPASPPAAAKGNDDKESFEDEPVAGRQEREQVAAPTVDDSADNLAVTESDQRAARYPKMKSTAEPAPEPAFGGTLEITAAQDSLVAAAVDSSGGLTIRPVDKDDAGPRTVLVAIPAERYPAFLARLDEIGVSRGRLPDRVPGGVETVTVKIVVK